MSGLSRIDPAKVRAGRAGGLAKARKRYAHLSDTEVEVMRELERQAHSYRRAENGSPGAVAAWLRGLANRLEDAES